MTATTAEGSWDESGSMSSDFKPVADTHPFCPKADTVTNIRGEETRKERDRRLLRQHRENYKGPKKRRKQHRRLEHHTRMTSIHEDIGEEIITHENARENKGEQYQYITQTYMGVAVAVDSKLKEDVTHTRTRKMEKFAREMIKKRSVHKSKNTRRTKKVSNPGLRVTFVFRMVKWWTVFMSILPYTCAANRYANMRSNWRFKPGD